MGVEVLTLADVWPDNPRAMIVGINPAPRSVEAGHYFQGRGARGQFDRLVSAGLLPPTGRFVEDAAIAAGIGITDIVKRPTASADGLSRAELAFGTQRLRDRLAGASVPSIICLYKPPAEAICGRGTVLGWQPGTTSWGARVFRLPGPYEAANIAEQVMATLVTALRVG